MHSCAWLLALKLLNEGGSVGWYPRDVRYFGFSKPSFIKHLQILQVKKALEIKSSLCSKELFLLSFVSNGIWLSR